MLALRLMAETWPNLGSCNGDASTKIAVIAPILRQGKMAIQSALHLLAAIQHGVIV